MFWTLDTVPGPRYGVGKPVCVLPSTATFAGAEEFSFKLRKPKCAALVGESTGGGVNPGASHRLNEYFARFVPGWRPISPITGTNGKGSGVEPHLTVDTADAWRVAALEVLKALLAGAVDASEQTALGDRISALEPAAPSER